MIILLVVVVLIALWLIGTFNGLVTLKNRVDEAWSDIDVQLKRRYDLIPNLVNTVKGYATHESAIFTRVAEARAAAMGANSLGSEGRSRKRLDRHAQILVRRRGSLS